MGLPWRHSGWVHLPCRVHRFYPCSRKVPPAVEQLSPVRHNHWVHALGPRVETTETARHNPWSSRALELTRRNYWAKHSATATDACVPRACAQEKHHNEKPTHGNEE